MIHLHKKTRLTLLTSGGVNWRRYTLQFSDSRARKHSFKLEALKEVGLPPDREIRLLPHGWRQTLALAWSAGLYSDLETWSGSAWVSGGKVLTVVAALDIQTASKAQDILVEPYLGDSNWPAFQARAFDKAAEIRDISHVVHVKLGIELRSVGLVDKIKNY